MGVDLNELGFSQPSYLDGDDGMLAEMEVILEKVRGKRSVMLVLDSVASTNTKAEFDQGLMGEPAMAEQARVWSFCLRKLNKLLDDSQSTLLLLNQVRAKPGVMYGAKETTPGGNAIKFYATMRLKTNHGEKLDDGLSRVVGVTAVKNKVAPPWRHADFKLSFGGGFDDKWSVMRHAKENGCVDKQCQSLDEAIEALGWAKEAA
jgi:recombination protein RecA